MLASANKVGVVAVWSVKLKSGKTHIQVTVFGAVKISGYWECGAITQGPCEQFTCVFNKGAIATGYNFLLITPVLVDGQILVQYQHI